MLIVRGRVVRAMRYEKSYTAPTVTCPCPVENKHVFIIHHM